MVKKRVGEHNYYYLQHTIREGGKPEKKERYLGTSLPSNVQELSEKFLRDLYLPQWEGELGRIREGYLAEVRRTPKSAVEKDLEILSINFTYNTQRIEGSTLTHRETADLLEHGITPAGRPLRDVKEAEAHQQIFYDMLAFDKELTLAEVLFWHRKLFLSTRPDIAGKQRVHQVRISGSKFLPPTPVEIPPLLEDLFRWLRRKKHNYHPVELAALVHLKFVTIHPFADGNGRISRLMMNHTLKRGEYPLFVVPYEGRRGYYRALESAQTRKEPMIFVRWFIKRYIREYRHLLGNKRESPSG
ncbi:MAG: Fic family protein [Nitrososphaerota archaeon]|nr:Fic family protein [Nitrososphaerota archaeon]